jgi:hypothetical protein
MKAKRLANISIEAGSMLAAPQSHTYTVTNVWPGIVRQIDLVKHDTSVHEVITMELDIREKERPEWRLTLKIWLNQPSGMAKWLGKDVEMRTSKLPYDPEDSMERPDACAVGANGEPCRLERLEAVGLMTAGAGENK